MAAKSRGGIHKWALHAFLIVMAAVAVYPVLWLLALAFSGQAGPSFFDLPPAPALADRLRALVPWPRSFTPASFVTLFREPPFALWLLNSLIVSAATSFAGVFLGCTAGYGLSRYRFPGRRAALRTLRVSRTLPTVLILVPLYLVLAGWLGLAATHLGLVLAYSSTALPFCVWMLKRAFDRVPVELDESALLDGASATTVFTRIVLPAAWPAVAVAAAFSFMAAWNEFALALVFLDRQPTYTLPVGLRSFVDGGGAPQWGLFAAGSIVASLPAVALFLLLATHLLSGLAAAEPDAMAPRRTRP